MKETVLTAPPQGLAGLARFCLLLQLLPQGADAASTEQARRSILSEFQYLAAGFGDAAHDPAKALACRVFKALEAGEDYTAALRDLSEIVAKNLFCPEPAEGFCEPKKPFDFDTEIAGKAEISRLSSLAYSDALTGSENRHAFESAMTALRDAGGAFALLIADLDGLKAINTAHGHMGGDAVLCHVAASLGAGLRRGDRLCRIGGDEFAILLPGVRGARTLARIAARLIATLPPWVPEGDVPMPASISIGGAFAAGERAADTLYERADRALLRAKERGPGSVEIARAATIRRRVQEA